MELKTGDKVRFLNEKGGGIVTGFISSTMVNVAIEEGFEVPVLIKDLILIEPKGAAGRFFDRELSISNPITEKTSPAIVDSPRRQPEVKPETEIPDENDRISPLYRQSGMRMTEGIYLAYAPHDQKWLITGDLDLYLINHSSYDAIFSFSLSEGDAGYAGVDYDVLPAYSKMLIETITREDLESWSNGLVQVIFHSTEAARPLSPLYASFKIKPVRFYRESSYQDFPLIGMSVVSINLGDIAGQVIMSTDETIARSGISPAAREKLTAIAPAAIIDIHKTAAFEAEVDLHISALLKDYSSMSSAEILNYQTDYFSRMIDSAMAHNYRKVIFIHGIGNGSLRNAIIDILKQFEHAEYRNAPFATYGYGALEVNLNQEL